MTACRSSAASTGASSGSRRAATRRGCGPVSSVLRRIDEDAQPGGRVVLALLGGGDVRLALGQRGAEREAGGEQPGSQERGDGAQLRHYPGTRSVISSN